MKLLALSTGAALLVVATCVNAGAVVVSKDSPIHSLNADDAKRIFLGRETEYQGASVVVIYQKNEAIRTDFEKKILEKTGPDLSAYWAKQIFTGKAVAPTEVGSDADVRAKVNGTPGAFGYISDAAVDGTVKVLLRY